MNKLLLLTISLALFCTATYSQVTIGSNSAPVSGALLQLQNITTGSNGETATKGMGLPRVKLSELKPTTPAGLAASIGNASGSYDLATHTGLIVYNIDQKDACKPAPGMYVWDGEEWQFLGNKEEAVDKRTITYGAETTLPSGQTSGSFTLSYNDGTNPAETTSYRYASFGAAGIWMTENLATKYLPDGSILTKSTASNSSYTQAQYFTPNGVADNSALINGASADGKQGLLYNWPAAMSGAVCVTVDQGQVAGSTPGPNEVEVLNGGSMQGICPKGWHLPSDREWNELEKAITVGANTYSTLSTYTPAQTTWTDAWDIAANWRGTIQGTVMKSSTPTSTTYATNGTSKTAAAGGFDVLLAGSAYGGSASSYGLLAYLWSSSSRSSNDAWGRRLYSGFADVNRSYDARYGLFSVRCKKD